MSAMSGALTRVDCVTVLGEPILEDGTGMLAGRLWGEFVAEAAVHDMAA